MSVVAWASGIGLMNREVGTRRARMIREMVSHLLDVLFGDLK